MGKKFLVLVLALILCMYPLTGVSAHELSGSQYSPSYIVMSSETGQVLLSRDSTSPANISLLYKMMVSLIALETLSTTLKAPVEGIFYPVPDLIKLTMLTETNDATIALAGMIAPTRDDQIVLLNTRAKEMGLNNTIFADTMTADNQDFQHSNTTLTDIATFIYKALNNKEFRILYCSQATVLSTDGTLISNSNKMVMAAGNSKNVGGTTCSYHHNNGKYTSMSYLGRITSISNNLPIELIIVADHMYGIDHNTLGQNLITNISQHYYKKTVITKGDILLSYKLGSETLDISATNDIYCIISADVDTPILQTSFIMNEGYDFEEIAPPIYKGEDIGIANIQLFDGSVVTTPVEAANTIYIESSRINDLINLMSENRQVTFIIFALLAIEALLILFKLRIRK
ncbi:MAG: hypothetical protein E7388_00080 [Ruminococcaceae bacterium]|nr:hypothetical protein [Oscillospiraceae bacterium]